MNAYEEVCHWEKTEAAEIMKQCGVTAGMTVMDFGCGHGHYTIPAAIAVGSEGRVFGIEKVKKIAKKASQRLEAAGITNAEIHHCDHHGLHAIADESVDFVMMYDVIHHAPHHELIQAMKARLKTKGILSFLAFKDICGYKSSELEPTLARVTADIERAGFVRMNPIPNTGVHFDHFHSTYHWKRYGEVRLSSLERGTIYNFQKIEAS
ncbi:class I SAM-dependent methyltransferase [Paenibacillus spongiae]|uniref:Class I SAM-dependent methyltransferase n=1 Tax=Paenibacillus spongiae TaxID=2909671 RepID=A0ABY5SI71_9BACL|nr:class I SAM-dependent methyltransferase [Paenibacillus spongiae]UVI33155.1 class I SAM-dependent methyltransferase [Paenibacillus spongiae]